MTEIELLTFNLALAQKRAAEAEAQWQAAELRAADAERKAFRSEKSRLKTLVELKKLKGTYVPFPSEVEK